MAQNKQFNRLPAVTVPVNLGYTTTHDGKIHAHQLIVSLAYDPKDHSKLRELVFVSRGKIGHGMDELFHELGIKLSRIIQGRNPDTGALEEVQNG